MKALLLFVLLALHMWMVYHIILFAVAPSESKKVVKKQNCARELRFDDILGISELMSFEVILLRITCKRYPENVVQQWFLILCLRVCISCYGSKWFFRVWEDLVTIFPLRRGSHVICRRLLHFGGYRRASKVWGILAWHSGILCPYIRSTRLIYFHPPLRG